MTILFAAETVLLALLSLLVVGLLRSHAEILRSLESGTPRRAPASREDEFDPRIARPNDDEIGGPASEVVGTTIEGDARKVAFPAGGPGTLIAFLSSGCTICREFWGAFAQDPLQHGTNLLVVTKDSSHESPSKLNRLAGDSIPVVMSTAAWQSYDVPLAPYFVYVDGKTGRIFGEGAASNWGQLKSLFTDFLFDQDPSLARADRGPTTAGGQAARAARIDGALDAAGVDEDDPSFYEPPQLPEDEAVARAEGLAIDWGPPVGNGNAT
jgi:hypothetical protein